MIPEKLHKYVIERQSIVKVVEVQLDGKTYIVNPGALTQTDQPLLSKEDASYKLFVDRVSKGVPVTNYSRSKYYKMYLERAKIENPEILFQ
jgi:hypothetical protein